jgi:ATP-binding cassette subfamily C protein LapB
LKESFIKKYPQLTPLLLPGFWTNALDLIVSSFLINIFTLVLPLVILQLYDRILPYNGIGSLSWLMLGAALAVILESIIRQFRTLIGAWWWARVEFMLSKNLINKVLNSKTDEFLKSNPGVYLDKINSVNDLSGVFSGNVFQMMLDLPFAYLFIWCIWVIAGPMVWIPLIIIAIYLIFIFICNRAFIKTRERQLEIHEKQFAFYMESFSGIHSIKSIAMEESVLRRSEAIHSEFSDSENRVQFWSKLPGIAGKVLSQVALFSVILYGAFLLINNSLTLGILTASVMLVRRAMTPFIMLSSSWIQLSKAKLALNKYREIAEIPQESNLDKPLLPCDIDGAVIFKNVSYTQPASTFKFFRNVNFEIKPRSFICFSGDHQDETTALALMIYGAIRPESGNIYIDHYDISQWSMANNDASIAYVPNKGILFNGTVMDNITVFEPGKEVEAMNVAAFLGLDDEVAKLPAGFQTKVNALSNKIFPTSLIQRITLARALMRYPRVLILDRVNQAVDKETEKILQLLLSKLIGCTTVIMVTNDQQYIRHADKSFRIENGKCVEEKSVSGRKSGGGNSNE